MDQQARWVPETRFGAWFQQTRVWHRHVVVRALDDLERMLRCSGGPTRFERMLDAGCGAGVAFAELTRRFGPRHVTGLDIDPEMVAAARATAATMQAEGGTVDVREAALESSGLPDASFDGILCHQTLHHASRQQEVLGEMHRLLAPGGVLLLAESCAAFTRSLAVRALFRHPDHVQHSAEGYLERVRKTGFRVAPGCTSTPDPFWARPGFGLRERFGGHPRPGREPSQVQIVARRS